MTSGYKWSWFGWISADPVINSIGYSVWLFGWYIHFRIGRLPVHSDSNDGAIRFTEFVLPRGEKRNMFVQRPFAITQKAKHIMALGYRFEAEVLTTGQVSLTITSDTCDVCIEVCNNGPEVLEAVDRLILSFDEETAAKKEQAYG